MAATGKAEAHATAAARPGAFEDPWNPIVTAPMPFAGGGARGGEPIPSRNPGPQTCENADR